MVHSSKLRRACAPACLLSFSIVGLGIASTPAQAQAEAVVVTGSREPTAASRLAADVAVISAETIRNSTADSVADLLRREAGVQLSRNGGPGQSTGIFLRGAGSQQSVVLVDGVRVGSATLGYAALESLSLQQIERIEVLRGPGSSLYGADAVGGVVQIFTRGGTAGEPGTRFEARLAAGGYSSTEAALGVRGAAGPWDYAASLSSERSDGVSALKPGDRFGNYNPDRDGYRQDAAQLRLGLQPAVGHRLGMSLVSTRVDTQYDASEFLPPSFTQNPAPDFRTRLATDVATLDWRGDLATGLVGSARASYSEDDSRSGGSVTNRFVTKRSLLGAQLAWRSGPGGQWVAALESNEDRASSTSFAADVSRRNQALVLEFTGSAGPWSWQADARRDNPSDFDAVSTGRLGGSVTLAPGLRLRALAGSTFRAPSFNDLYFPNYGVATLQPERGRSVELGLSWRAAHGEAAATAYRNEVSDLIGYQSDRSFCPPDPGYDFGCAGNISQALLQGLTLSAASRHGALSLKAQFDFLKAEDQTTGAPLPRRAEHQGSLGADWTAGDWTVGASLLYVGSRPDGGKTLAAETTLDLQTTWRLAPAWQLQAKLLNATQETLEPARDYQGLGRQAWLVLRYEPRF